MRNDLRHVHKVKLRTLMSRKERLTKRQEPRSMKPTWVKGDTTYQEPINIRDWSLLIPGTGAEGNIIFSPKNS